jgi:hypothetical protein
VSKLYLLPLTKGLQTCVDKADFERFSKFKYGARTDDNGAYAQRCVYKPAGTHTHVLLHREILNAPPGVEVDHKRGVWLNGDPTTKILDNRRSNLRLATGSQNKHNVGKRRDNTSGWKGVTWHKRAAKWTAQIKLHGQGFNLGYHATREDAASAYDTACAFLHGLKYGRPNSTPDLDNLPPKVEQVLAALAQQIVERSVNRPEDFQ